MTRARIAAYAATGAVAYALVPALAAGNDFVLGLLVAALTIAGVSVAWAMLANLGGLVSFGHAAFFGLGGYASALLSMKAGCPVPAALVLGGVAAAAGGAVALPALRLRGPYFALALLAYSQVLRIAVSDLRFTGGAAGLLSIPRLPAWGRLDLASRLGTYLLAATLVLLATAAYDAVHRSTYGLALRAMHDSELATRAVGVASTRLKAAMLLASAFVTGVMGALNAHVIGFLEPPYAFSGDWTLLPIVGAILGGYRTLWGPALGALVMFLADQLLFKALLPYGHQLVLGVLLGAVILVAPEGVASLVPRGPRRRGRHAVA